MIKNFNYKLFICLAFQTPLKIHLHFIYIKVIASGGKGNVI